LKVQVIFSQFTHEGITGTGSIVFRCPYASVLTLEALLLHRDWSVNFIGLVNRRNLVGIVVEQ